jgi:hypothetical protein
MSLFAGRFNRGSNIEWIRLRLLTSRRIMTGTISV